MVQKSFLGVFLGTVVIVSGCASTATFAAPANGERGQLGTYYEIDVGGKNWGDAKVWLPGTFPEASDGRQRMLRFDLRLRNDSNEELMVNFDRFELEIITKDHQAQNVQIVPPLEKTSGANRISPASTRRLEVYFALPGGMAVGDIETLDLSWAIQTPAGLYSQSTPYICQSDRDEPQTHIIYPPGYPGYPWYPWQPWPHLY